MSLKYISGNYIISYKMCASEDELNILVKDDKNILSGEEEEPKNFVLVELFNQNSRKKIILGLIFVQNFSPQVVQISEQIFAIGFDKYIYIISMTEPIDTTRIELPYYFWEFLKQSNNTIIAIHELGASCISNSAEIVWQMSGTDKLIDYEIIGSELKLIFDDESSETKTITQ